MQQQQKELDLIQYLMQQLRLVVVLALDRGLYHQQIMVEMEDLEEELHFLELLELVHLDREITVVLVHLLQTMVMEAAEGQLPLDQMEQQGLVAMEDLEQHLLFLDQVSQEVEEEVVGFMLAEHQGLVELVVVGLAEALVVQDQAERLIPEEVVVEEGQTMLISPMEAQEVLE
jgi:hypothetical protein